MNSKKSKKEVVRLLLQVLRRLLDIYVWLLYTVGMSVAKSKFEVAEYYLTSPHKKAREFRKDVGYKDILRLALQTSVKANDVYQRTNVAENKKQRGRTIGTMLKNLVKWGFLVKAGQRDKLYRQELFSLNEELRKQIRLFVED